MKVKRNPKVSIFVFIVIFFIFLLFYYVVFILPVSQVSQFGINNTTENAILIDKYRTTSIQIVTTLAQIFGGIAVLIGIYFAWKNIKVAQEGQITERFTRAIDQLGHQNLEIRLGGIYALERISNESEKDYWPIMEILTAYVRKNSPNIPICNKISFDIEAIITVIRRRKYFFDNGELFYLDFLRTNLQGAYLAEAHLEVANLEGANFRGANLIGTHLEGANLIGANFEMAYLEGANFQGALLQGAYLKGAKGLIVDQLYEVKTLHDAILDEKLRMSLEEKYPEEYKALIQKSNKIK